MDKIIISDWKFDEKCRKNAKNRHKNKNYKKKKKKKWKD